MKKSLIILGAAHPHKGKQPAALIPILKNQRVLDWVIDAFSVIDDLELHFVAGYRADGIIDAFPNMLFSINPQWQDCGSLGSLFVAPLSSEKETYVTYADVLCSKTTLESLEKSQFDVSLLVDRQWKTRYGSRSQTDLLKSERVCLDDKGMVTGIGTELELNDSHGEFVGVAKFSPKALSRVIELQEQEGSELKQKGLPHLIEILINDGFQVGSEGVQGHWAELNEPRDLAHFILGNKADTLQRLQPVVKNSIIGDQVIFKLEDWNKIPQKVLNKISAKFFNQKVVVRSSALTEDCWGQSNAGNFTSRLDISSNDADQLKRAIEEVITSYGDEDPNHQVLVQEMVADVRMSGVLFTRSLRQGAPYYIINYDDESSRTDTVTDGTGKTLKTVYASRFSLDKAKKKFPNIANIIEAAEEIETVVGHDSLDIEFAVDKNDRIVVFQVRPLICDFGRLSDNQAKELLHRAKTFFHRLQQPSPQVLGDRTFFGVMPDWNPAEIIGRRPRNLAKSLYQELVTNDIWAQQRAGYGYRDVRPQPLMFSFAGQPFIDIRASLNSFVPASLDDSLAEKLINFYLRRLENNPHFHDKIEFQVAWTCWDFDFNSRAEKILKPEGFTTDEIRQLRESLLQVTRAALKRNSEDLKKIEVLSLRYDKTLSSDLAPERKIAILLDDCKRFGTLPFSHLARSAFVASSMLRSLLENQTISRDEYSGFLNSLETVAKEFERDLGLVALNSLSLEELIQKYGHLRPGTYELTSPNYAADPKRFLQPAVYEKTSETAQNEEPSLFQWSAKVVDDVNSLLATDQLDVDFKELVQFFKEAMEGREYAKFIFTRNLNSILELCAKVGEDLGIGPEEASHLAINDFLKLHTEILSDESRWFKKRLRNEENHHQLAHGIELPPLICSDTDIEVFELPDSEPNFVTEKSVTAEIIELQTDTEPKLLEGKLVLIPQADPGYDWLFGYPIVGLITMYGGANSHMTIRSAERGLPAAIGVGERLYSQLILARMLELNCGSRQIKII